MFFSVLFTSLAERNLKRKLCSSHRGRTENAAFPSNHSSLGSASFGIRPCFVAAGAFRSHLYCWIISSKVAQQTSMLPGIIHTYQIYVLIFLREPAWKYPFITFKILCYCLQCSGNPPVPPTPEKRFLLSCCYFVGSQKAHLILSQNSKHMSSQGTMKYWYNDLHYWKRVSFTWSGSQHLTYQDKSLMGKY